MKLKTVAITLKNSVIVFFDKLALTSFVAGAGTYLANHGKVTELDALKAAGFAAAIAGLVFASNAASNYLSKNNG